MKAEVAPINSICYTRFRDNIYLAGIMGSMSASGQMNMVQVPTIMLISVDFDMSTSHSILTQTLIFEQYLSFSHIFWPDQLEDKTRRPKKIVS